MSASGIASLVGAAAPGIAKGIGGAVDSYNGFKQDQMLDDKANTESAVAGSPQTSSMADANHPVWNFLNNVIGGAPQQPSPVPTGTGIPMPAMPASDMGAALPPVAQAPQQLAEGGVVKQNSGIPTLQPGFVVGPSSGIVPASTQGQILTMDAGGVVPDGFHEQQGISGVPMGGRGAALVEGLQAGQNLGHNFAQAWHENRARSAAADYAGQVGAADVNGTPDQGGSQGILGKAKDAIEGFFHHIHEGTLDDNHQPNAPAQGSPNAPAPGALPTPDAGAAPQGPAPSPVAPGATPGGAAPPGGPAPSGPSGPAAAPAVGGSPNVPAQPQQGQPQQVTPQQAATANVVKQVATDPNVAAGVPDKTPDQSGKPHSLTPDYWAKMNDMKIKAVQAAARAGEDPAKVYESLTAMQNAHFQGQVLKQAATASRAFDNGDMGAVKQALKNINYYLPDGQDVDIKQATAADVAKDPTLKLGDLMHSNPYAGMYGHQGEPDYIKVDQPYLQSLGQGALDPTKMQQAQLARYTASMEAKEKNTSAQGAFMTGQGKEMAGAAAMKNAKTREALAPFDINLKKAQATNQTAQAGLADRKPVSSNGAPKISMASYQAAVKAAGEAVNQGATGERTSQAATEPQFDKNGKPLLDASGKPVMGLSLSPVAGKTINDPTQKASVYLNMSPDRRREVTDLAGQLAGANLGVGGMTPTGAADFAARVYAQKDHPTSHVDPKTGQKVPDLIVNSEKGTIHIWRGNQWVNANTEPNLIDEEKQSPVPSGGGSGGGSPDSGSNDTDSVLQD